ncbi:MAG: BTAD domain-containing putative transcriptional regulator [Acidimicrobiia bacterium]
MTARALLQLSVLGPLVAEIDGAAARLRPGMVTRILLHLASTPGGWWSAERLIDEVWADRPQPSGHGAVQTHASVLARQLAVGGHSLVEQQRHRGYRLVGGDERCTVVIDEQRFRAQAEEGERLASRGHLDDAIEQLDAALALWRGPDAYPEAAGCPTLAAHGAELAARRLATERRWAHLLLETGRAAESIPRLEAALVLRPDDQVVVGSLMRAHAATGRPQEASRLYSSLVRLLRDQHGDAPLPELRDLDRRIITGELTEATHQHGSRRGTGTTGPALQQRPGAAPQQDGSCERIGLGSPVPHDRRPLVAAEPVVEEATDRLLERGQLTLVGPLGVGKSRVAREVCRRAASHGVPTIGIVSLAGCADYAPDRVVDRIAEALGAPIRSAAGFGRLLVERLGDRPAVLVLDNSDDALDAVTAFVLTALGVAPRLAVLVTSREPMRIPAEVVLAVPPLATSGEHVDLLTTGPSPAAQLLMARLSECAGGSAQGADWPALSTVERICRRLDGLPLALEVAAGLAARHDLEQVDVLLAAGAGAALMVRGAHSAQRTLSDAIGWSWARLGDTHRPVLVALCMFSGAAEVSEIATVAQRDAATTLTALIGLAERSLIQMENAAGAPRYRALETVRAVITGLADAEQLYAMRAEHAGWVVSLAQRASRAGQHTVLHARTAELRSALRWLIETGDDARAISLADASQSLLYRLAPAAELTLWLNRVAADSAAGRRSSTGVAPKLCDERTQIHAVAVDLRNLVAMTTGELATAGGAQPALYAVDGSSRPHQQARALVVATLWAVMSGNDDEAATFVERARGATDDDWLLAWVDAADAFRCRRTGRFDAARELAQRSLAAFTDLQDVHGSVLPALTLARLDVRDGQMEVALDRMVAATADAARLGDRLLTSLGHLYQAHLHFDSHEFAEACRSLRAALHAGVTAHRIMFASTLEHIAGLAVATGHLAEAVRLCGFSFAHRPKGPNMPPPRRQDFLAHAKVELGRASFERQLRQGQRLDANGAIELAERCLGLVLTN